MSSTMTSMMNAPEATKSAKSDLWYIGICLEIVSTLSGTVGKQLIRLSEHKRRQQSLRQSTIFFYVGMFVNTLVGPFVDMAAYSFAAQSLIAPFGGLDVVWNAILAPWILNEQLTPKRLLGCTLIVVGTGMAGLFGNHEDSEYSLEYLEALLINERVVLYFVAFFLWFLANRFFFMQWASGTAIRGISLGCTSGTIAGNMFCVKAAIELIERSIGRGEVEIWMHWLPYVLVVGAVFFALTNVIYMTKGLQEYEALFMVTIYEGSMIVSGCISGSIVLLDLRGLESWRVGMYFLSVIIVVAGMCVIFMQERMSKSSLAAGTASIAEIQQPEWANKHGRDILHELRDRSLHASTLLPPEPLARANSRGQDAVAPQDGSSSGAPPSGHRVDGEAGVPQISIIDVDEQGVQEKPEGIAMDRLSAALPPRSRAGHKPWLEALSAASPKLCVVRERQASCFGFVLLATAPLTSPADSEKSQDRNAQRQSNFGGQELRSCGPITCATGRLLAVDGCIGGSSCECCSRRHLRPMAPWAKYLADPEQRPEEAGQQRRLSFDGSD